ncbi:MAG: LamG-like jellyroll fold domain-containing protein [bacterium]|nr:LamG-like jellyroll fold domain-containing protein [bacterium]
MFRGRLVFLVVGLAGLGFSGVAFSEPGNALHFEGGQQKVSIPHSSNLSFHWQGEFTVEMWVRNTNSNTTQYHLIGKRADYINYQFAWSKPDLFFGNNSVWVNYNLPLNQWTHLAGTYRNRRACIYINGELVACQDQGTPVITNNADLKIGMSGNYGGFSGEIDEVRIWNVARTESQITGNYNKLVAPFTEGLVGYWRFDEANPDAQTVIDFSGFDNHGTLGLTSAVEAADPARVVSTAPIDAEFPYPPVVLVHGWNSGPEIWDDYVAWLENDGFTQVWVADNIEPCGVLGEEHFDLNANNLAQFIINRASLVGYPSNGPINIVAHSMGGLLSRRLLHDPSEFGFGFEVQNLIMLGTPNLGSVWGGKPIAEIKCSPGPAWNELSFENMLEFNRDFQGTDNTKIHLVAGYGGCDVLSEEPDYNRDCSELFSSFFVLCPHDGIVAVNSALYYPPRFNTVAIDGGWCHSNSLGNALTYYEDPFLFVSFVEPILLDQQQLLASRVELATLDFSSTNVGPQVFIEFCDSIIQGISTSIVTQVEGGEGDFFFYSSDPDLDFTLESPTGLIWDSASAEADLTVTYRRPDSIVQSFLFDDLEPGEWTVHIDATDANQVVVKFCVVGGISSSLVVETDIPQDYYWSGAMIPLSLSLLDNGIGLTGAMVEAVVIRDRTDTLNQLVLFDDGLHGDDLPDDGVYGISLVAPADSTGLSIHFLATGTTLSGNLFERRVTRGVYILPSSLAPGDMDENGIFDIFDVVGLIDYVFRNGSPPFPDFLADVNCDSVHDIFDVVTLINHVFRDGPQPQCP